MRRSRIRRKSRTPKAWKDADLLARFAENHTTDEVEPYLCGPVWEQVRNNFHLAKALHTHHVFHAGKRSDIYCNLIRVSAAAHHYLHKEPIGGAMACIWAVICRERATFRTFRASMLADYDTDDAMLWSDWLANMKADLDEACGNAGGFLGWVQAKRDGGSVPTHYLDTVQAILETF